MTTPPNPPEGDDNIYGSPPPPPPPGQNPYGAGQNPYGAGQNPYGATPYPGGPAPYGAQAPATKTDGVSIAAFVTGLVCCAPVGVVLGIIGIRRTKDGQRKGRWAAVVGLILGGLGILAWVGLVVGGVWIFNNTITADNAEVGQCANIDHDGDELTFLKKDCSDDHDGEIVYTGDFSEIKNADVMPSDTDVSTDTAISKAVCSSVMDPADVAKIGDDLEWGFALEDNKDPKDDDNFFCFVESSKNNGLSEKILD